MTLYEPELEAAKDHLGLLWCDYSQSDNVPDWWDTERCPQCGGHIYCCGCDGSEERDCTHG